MKIGIITLNGYCNYGNRLQNYAMEKILSKQGDEVVTLINKTNNNIKVKQKNIIVKIKDEKFYYFFKKLKHDFYRKLNLKRINNLENKRSMKFINFSEKYLNESIIHISNNTICENREYLDTFDYYVVGSDQVWNPNDITVSELNFMTFAEKHKRLMYAPSFGISNIPSECKKMYTEWILGLENICVREDAGRKIIYDLTGKEALVVVDPTMLLDKAEWLSIAKEHNNKPKGRYILTYFLGEIHNNINLEILKIARDNNLEVINLANLKYEAYYSVDPSEFIDYINSAEIFVTDSFHGCVFSILMNTPLVICDRSGNTKKTNMSSRIDTLISKFYLNNRKFENISKNDYFIADYRRAYKVLEEEREKSFEYLNRILGWNV
ncbi:MAG: polysaccharide pyruvyl transferase family protein [Sarcina sp.]